MSRAFLSFVIFSARLTRGGDGCTLVSLIVSASLNSIRTNITAAQLIIYSSNTQVELSLKYMMYRNEHLSGTDLTIVSLSFIVTTSYDTHHILKIVFF